MNNISLAPVKEIAFTRCAGFKPGTWPTGFAYKEKSDCVSHPLQRSAGRGMKGVGGVKECRTGQPTEFSYKTESNQIGLVTRAGSIGRPGKKPRQTSSLR